MNVVYHFVAVDLVYQQEDAFLRPAQHLGDIFIHGSQALFCVDHEKDHIRFINGKFNLLLDLIFKNIPGLMDISTGIDYRIKFSVPVPMSVMPVAGDPAGWVNDGLTPSA